MRGLVVIHGIEALHDNGDGLSIRAIEKELGVCVFQSRGTPVPVERVRRLSWTVTHCNAKYPDDTRYGFFGFLKRDQVRRQRYLT